MPLNKKIGHSESGPNCISYKIVENDKDICNILFINKIVFITRLWRMIMIFATFFLLRELKVL